MVTSADIARLGGVGRAAVSNWRRRYPDFPRPVAGTASSPMFSLHAVQSWFSANGRPVRITLAEQVWQRLRAASTDLALGDTVARAGAHLVRREEGKQARLPGDIRPDALGRPLRTVLDDLVEQQGTRAAFEQLCQRYQAAHARTLATTPAPTAQLMARMLDSDPGTLLDPACGLGTLLLEAGCNRLHGEDLDETTAAITAVRLRLAGLNAEIVAGDALRENTFGDRSVDAVLCNPPFNVRGWGRDELADDPRWIYGRPPRGEPELAWVQHCLAAVRPGGTVVLLLPRAVASRRAGKRIRANLLRSGALLSVHTLPEGQDVWCLQRPRPDQRHPTSILLHEHTRPPEGTEPGQHGQHVPIINILDEFVDLRPARQRLLRERAGAGATFRYTRDTFRTAVGTIDAEAAREFDTSGEPGSLPTTTLAELIKAGALAVLTAEPDHGRLPVLTQEDLSGDRRPSSPPGQGIAETVRVRAGDVVASPSGMARVVTEEAALAAQLTGYRPASDRIDPHFLAGAFRAAAPRTASSNRIDPRRIVLPSLPLQRQRAYATAFEQLDAMRTSVHELAELADSLAELGFTGLLDGQIGPAADD